MRNRYRGLLILWALVLSLLGVLSIWALVLVDEISTSVSLQPLTELAELLTQTVDGLLVHVGLGDELRQARWS